MKRRHLRWSGLALCASLCWMGVARADMAPAPERPQDWDEHPAPTPEIPLEDTLARRLVPLLALSMAGGTLVAAARRGRTVRRQGAR